MPNEKNTGCAERILCAPVFITLQHHHPGVTRFAVAGFVDGDDAIFQLLAAGLLDQCGLLCYGGCLLSTVHAYFVMM